MEIAGGPMIPEIFQEGLESLQQQYGADSLDRVRQFLDCGASKAGRNPFQKGARYVFPFLDTCPWLDFASYPLIKTGSVALQDNHAAIKGEILARIQRGPLGYYESSGPTNSKWRSLYLIKNGITDEELADDFPVSKALIERHFRSCLYPLGEVFFSALLPGAHISRHCDITNFFICLHFGVVVPAHCGLRVAGETRIFGENEVYLFDHSYEHDAWNRSDSVRINLLFDVWHPDISLVEREALTFCFQKLRQEISEVNSASTENRASSTR